MKVRSIAVFSTGRDFNVAMLEMKIVGVRELGDDPGDMSKIADKIELELAPIVPRLRELPRTDLLMEDTARRLYLVRLYLYNARAEYILILSPRNTIRSLARKLAEQGWSLRLLVERKAAAKRSYWR